VKGQEERGALAPRGPITAETMAKHDEKISAGRAKMLSGGDTGD